MSRELGWKDAVCEVLKKSSEPMHYTDIADRILELNLKRNVGATPAATVAANISLSLKNEGDASPFIKVSRAIYDIRGRKGVGGLSRPAGAGQEVAPEELDVETGLINAFGMFWSRNKVFWQTTPKLMGQQINGANDVDFCHQRGVYLLHDGRHVVYVGRTTEQALGRRLYQHTLDRLNGRWDRFSWFGICSVTEKGELQTPNLHNVTLDQVIGTMEALLIEGLEPPQNRRQGDGFKAVEFLQVEDPAIRAEKTEQMMKELLKKVK